MSLRETFSKVRVRMKEANDLHEISKQEMRSQGVGLASKFV